MRWLVVELCTLGLLMGAACSDDGLPSTGDTDAGPSSGAQATSSSTGGATADSSNESAVTTASTSGSSQGSQSDSAPPGSSSSDPSGGSTGTGIGTDTATASDTEFGSSGTGEIPTFPCDVDADCEIINDCCACDSVHLDVDVPECAKDCLQPSCDAIGLPNPVAQCEYGVCTFRPVDCDPLSVTCDEEAPDCPDGLAPSVEEGCWGDCVPAEACDFVPGCEDCPEDEACVLIGTQIGNQYACTPVAEDCRGEASCECLPEICEEPFDTCGNEAGDAAISCSCIEC